MKTSLIDADIIAYTAAYASCTWVTEDEAWYDMGEAEKMVDEIIIDWTQQAECDRSRCILSPDDRTNYRLLLWPEYKTHRKSSKKPPHLSAVIDYIRNMHNGYSVPYLEGDDVLGILHTRKPDSTVIVSTDKDMHTVPGWHYNPNKDHGMGPQYVSPEQATRWLLTQVLTGDATDGYKGAKGVGPKRAEKVLSDFFKLEKTATGFNLSGDPVGCWEVVKDIFESKGQTVEEAVQNLAMARILTTDLYHKSGDRRGVSLPTAHWGVNEVLTLP